MDDFRAYQSISKDLKTRTLWILAATLLVLFAACKRQSNKAENPPESQIIIPLTKVKPEDLPPEAADVLCWDLKYTDECGELNCMIDIALNVHLTRTDADRSRIYFNALFDLYFDQDDFLEQTDISFEKIKSCELIDTLNFTESDLHPYVRFFKQFSRQLDQHSHYLTAEESRIDLAPQEVLVGLGITFNERLAESFDYYRYYEDAMPLEEFIVERVESKSPAAQAGIQRGDRIISMNKANPVRDWDMGQNNKFSRSWQKGEKVDIEFERNSAPMRTSAVANEYSSNYIDRYIYDPENRIGYVRFDDFPKFESGWGVIAEDVASFIENTHPDSDQPSLRGLVMDLRFNRGGMAIEALALAGMFTDLKILSLSKTKNVRNAYLERLGMKDRVSENPFSRAPLKDFPLAILVGTGSASAAETLGGILGATGNCVILLDQVSTEKTTHGKGVGMDPIFFGIDATPETMTRMIALGEIFTGEFVGITHYYYLPNGQSPQNHGISVDLAIPNKEFIAREQQIEKANETAKGKTLTKTQEAALRQYDQNLKARKIPDSHISHWSESDPSFESRVERWKRLIQEKENKQAYPQTQDRDHFRARAVQYFIDFIQLSREGAV